MPNFRECFAFPLSSRAARQDIIIGGLLLFFLLPGWILNLGHRLDVVHRLFHDQPPYFRGFTPWGRTFWRGTRAFTAIATYLSPAAAFAGVAWCLWSSNYTNSALVIGALAGLLFTLAIYVLPGGMTYNAAFNDITYLYRPDKAYRRAITGGSAYLWAWVIALSAISLSFFGLLVGGVGFFFTSVWAWSVVGCAFSKALVLSGEEHGGRSS